MGRISKMSQQNSLARQNWHTDCESAVNKQIDMEYYASHYYHQLYCFFRRDTVALENIANFFKDSSVEERDHAEKFMDYQTMRGGHVELEGVAKINLNLDENNIPEAVMDAFVAALDLEKTVNENLLNLHKIGTEHDDPQFTDFLEGEYLKEQVEANYELAKVITQLKLINGNGHGIWQFNKHFGEKS